MFENIDETIEELQIDGMVFNDDINKIKRTVHHLNYKLVNVAAKLNPRNLRRSDGGVHNDDSNDVLNSITFARSQIIHSST